MYTVQDFLYSGPLNVSAAMDDMGGRLSLDLDCIEGQPLTFGL